MARILSSAERLELHPALQDVIEYRKSGLSLNHVIGCPLDCAYCVRHLFDNFDAKRPRALMSDSEAVKALIQHPSFRRDVTPIQLFNRATDPFLPMVKPHTMEVLSQLDDLELRNHTLVITRYRVTVEDCHRLNTLKHLRVTLLITHSGIDDRAIEPVPSAIARASLRLAYENAARYRVILYWRPLIPGLNDTEAHITTACQLSSFAHATVFTGLFYRDQIRDYFQSIGLPEPYATTARRKILPEALERRIISRFRAGSDRPLFRKTSCGVAYAHQLPDYNGHYGIRELCDICPSEQVTRCARSHRIPQAVDVDALVATLGVPVRPKLSSRAIQVTGLSEQQRYFLQHNLAFQVHDSNRPHGVNRHGRADTGWT